MVFQVTSNRMDPKEYLASLFVVGTQNAPERPYFWARDANKKKAEGNCTGSPDSLVAKTMLRNRLKQPIKLER